MVPSYHVRSVCVHTGDSGVLMSAGYEKGTINTVEVAGAYRQWGKTLNMQQLPRANSPEGAAMLAAWARAHGAVMNTAHKELFLKHGINIEGIHFSEPIPMDFGALESRVYNYYDGESGRVRGPKGGVDKRIAQRRKANKAARKARRK